jgi:hypothetical protein
MASIRLTDGVRVACYISRGHDMPLQRRSVCGDLLWMIEVVSDTLGPVPLEHGNVLVLPRFAQDWPVLSGAANHGTPS